MTDPIEMRRTRGWLERLDEFGVSVKDHGAIGDGVSDDTAAVASALKAAAGGVLLVPPGTYKLTARLDIPTAGCQIRGVQGKSVFNFASKATWEQDFNAGLIRAQGSLGTAVGLTRRVLRTATIAPRVTAAARVATTVTADCDIDHGLAAGDAVWITGAPSAAQAVFFTVNRAVGASARTVPYIVTGTPTTKQFTYEVANVGDAALATTAYLYRAADVVQVASTAGFTAGQTVMVRSEATRVNGTETNRIGEFQTISRVLSATMLLLHSEVRDDYLAADTPQVVPVSMLSGFGISGVEIIGKGANVGAGYGDRAIMAYLCDDPMVIGCTFTRCDQMGTNIWSCRGGAVRNCRFTHDGSDESGQSSGLLDIQYGVGFGGCTTGLEIAGNTFIGGRHAVVQTMTSNAGYHGVARGITIQGNTCHGQWLASISTHQGVDNLAVVGNTIMGAEGGINIRYARNVTVNDNVVAAFEYGIYVYQHTENIVISGNNLRGALYAIRIDANAVNEFIGPILITGNVCIGGETGIYIYGTIAGEMAGNIVVDGNNIQSCKYEGIMVRVGNPATATDGWHGSIRNNNLQDVGLLGGRYGMWITNLRGGQINNNHFRGSVQVSRAIYIDGAGAGVGLHILGNKVAAGLVSVVHAAAPAGGWHRCDLPMSPTVVIAGGVAAPTFALPLLTIDTEAAAAADDLDTLTAGEVGQRVTLRALSAAKVVTAKDGTGNLKLGADRVLNATTDTLDLVWNGAAWCEVAFASND